ncbi:MAG: hypothetical protein IKM25_06740 [Clostridia bacterium]|nr:hypothetical protein [Clostridia bacterium]
MRKIKNFLALLTAASIAFSFVACGKENEEATTLPTQAENIVTEEAVTEPVSEETTAQTVTEPYTKQETTTLKAEQEKTTAGATKPAEIKPQTTKAQTTKPDATAPSSKADIIKLYNTALSGASTAKPGYSKTVNTTMSNINMGALSKISAVKEVVGDFLGEGKTSSTVKKGSFDGTSLVKSTLKEADITSATCKLSSDKKYYTVEITVKNETNPLKKSSALGRFTKDYKDVDEIKSGMSEAGAKVESITVKTSGVKITAKIAIDTNRLVSLTHTFKMSASLTNVKYSIAKVKTATADLSTTVSYSDFKY